jgi:hypothetical protein
LNFGAPASNGGATITSYSYSISGGSGGTGTLSTGSTGFPGGDGAGYFSITGLNAGTTYTFSVLATNSNGDSAATNSAAITTTAPATNPGAPTIGTLTTTGTTTATLTFTAPASNGGSTITSYTATSGSLTFTLSQSGSGTFTLTGLTAGSSYSFTVYATNSVGDSSPSAASNTVTMPLGVTVSGAPTITSAVANSDTSVNIYFDAPTSNGGAVITSYTITSTPAGITATLNQSTGGTFTISSLAPGTTYSFSIVATNSQGDSSPSNSISVSTLQTGLLPILAAAKSIQGGFTSKITNFNSSYTWRCQVADPYSCEISSSGLVTVAGAFNSGTDVLLTITSSRSGYSSLSANVKGTSYAQGIDKEIIAIEQPNVSYSKDTLIISQGKYQLLVNGWQKYSLDPDITYYEIRKSGNLLIDFSISNTNEATLNYLADKSLTLTYDKLKRTFLLSGLKIGEGHYILGITVVGSNTALTATYKLG